MAFVEENLYYIGRHLNGKTEGVAISNVMLKLKSLSYKQTQTITVGVWERCIAP